MYPCWVKVDISSNFGMNYQIDNINVIKKRYVQKIVKKSNKLNNLHGNIINTLEKLILVKFSNIKTKNLYYNFYYAKTKFIFQCDFICLIKINFYSKVDRILFLLKF